VFVGFRSGVAEVFVLVGYDAVSLGNRFQAFLGLILKGRIAQYLSGHCDPWRFDHYGISKRREPIIQWHGIVTQEEPELQKMLLFITRTEVLATALKGSNPLFYAVLTGK
jgi:hypothetical protein